MKAVVMAGGEGTRLRPLTSNQPKPMVPIVGKPCMEHILELLKRHELEDVVVTVAFLPQSIRGYFGHDQHGHLRPRARGPEARPDRPPVRLLEGALPAPARDGEADVRVRHGRLLAGHR